MLDPIRCFSCGRPYKEYIQIFKHILKQRSPHAQPTDKMMKDVLDALQLYQCCRTHIITPIQLCDELHN